MAAPRRFLCGHWRKLIFWSLLAFGFAVVTVRAQNTQATIATTDPAEARALNTVFARWGISAGEQWNISGELCSGAAINSTGPEVSPAIRCRCSFNNGTTCRITSLSVWRMDVVGPIPDEIWSLTMLYNLDLSENYLTGPVSPSIGNLTGLVYLNLGTNALSGPVPGELGMLPYLFYVSFRVNNFSGPLPPELGSLPNLGRIIFDSAGVSGPIPQTFANLQSLEIVNLSDNALTGRIPDFIGNWSSLYVLKMRGNSFQGPIPQSFSNLTFLNDLKISDLSTGTSSLDFLTNVSVNLDTLVLRNNKISGSIPSFSRFPKLDLLDLSFNNLTGRIPDALFNLPNLRNLYLGNNKLTGTLPSDKSSELQNIDLSYNELSGSLPNWFSELNLQINVVSNNLIIDNSSGSSWTYGLDCLQKNFPCSRGSPRYSSFAINCGGQQITAASGIVYDGENLTLGPAAYYVNDTRRWAFSNVGLPDVIYNKSYTTSTYSLITNALDSELFQTARISAGSLRYYGLGMENGNYTLTLQFAETVILGTHVWRSLGRRIFDIYVQGNLVEKDFDIKRIAGGSLVALARNYTVEVSENHIDIHLFWAGKGTCCVPDLATYGPLISAISATRNLLPTVSNQALGRRSKNRTGLIVGVVVGVSVAILLCLFAVFVLWQKKKQKDFEGEVLFGLRRKTKQKEDSGEKELLGIDARPRMFSYAELRSATNDFDISNKLGEGGFGPVFKGTLHGRAVAVKRLSVASRHGKSQFIAEIATISAVQHRNLVTLYGSCIEGDKRLLVYEYLENKSLDQILFGTGGKTLVLDWPMRFHICMGIAKGLSYLHEESRIRIVHRDVKSSNILLDSDFTPKISDFGLAKLFDDKKTHISTSRVAGTFGYLAPEYAMRGHLTEKADIFSFGVVALEIISGRPNSDTSLQDDMIDLLEWAWNLHEKNKIIELVDPSLPEYNPEEVLRIIRVAFLCTQTSPALRPGMSRVVPMLLGDIEVASVPTRPTYLTGWRFKDMTSSFMESDTASSTSNAETSIFNTAVNTTWK